MKICQNGDHFISNLINHCPGDLEITLGGTSPWSINFSRLLHCVPLYVCRLCINFQDLCARLLGMAALRILLLTFTSRFVIDFLSIRKVIIFSTISTDDRHPLMLAANCMMIRFRYIAQPRGGTENLLRTLT